MKCTNYFQIRGCPKREKVYPIRDETHIGIIQDINLKLEKNCNDNITLNNSLFRIHFKNYTQL